MKTFFSKTFKILIIALAAPIFLAQSLSFAYTEKRTYIGNNDNNYIEKQPLEEIASSSSAQIEPDEITYSEEDTLNTESNFQIPPEANQQVAATIKNINNQNPELIQSLITTSEQIDDNNNAVQGTPEISSENNQARVTQPVTIKYDDIPLKWEYKMKE